MVVASVIWRDYPTRSGRVVVQVDLVRLGDHFAIGVVATGRADVMRALQFAAVAAFVGVAGDQRIMRATHVAFGAGNAILRDSHVSTSVVWVRRESRGTVI